MSGAIGLGGQAEQKTDDHEDKDSLLFRRQHEARHEPILSIGVVKERPFASKDPSRPSISREAWRRPFPMAA